MRPVSVHLVMVSVSCSFSSFSVFLLSLKQQNLMKIMFSCIHFPIWPYFPKNNENLYFILVNCMGWQVCIITKITLHRKACCITQWHSHRNRNLWLAMTNRLQPQLTRKQLGTVALQADCWWTRTSQRHHFENWCPQKCKFCKSNNLIMYITWLVGVNSCFWHKNTHYQHHKDSNKNLNQEWLLLF